MPDDDARTPAGAALERFLAGIEHDAFRLARAATGDVDEALDLVQDAMFALVDRYADRPETEWRPLFHRVLQNRIRDWYRRRRVRSILVPFGAPRGSDGSSGDGVPAEEAFVASDPSPSAAHADRAALRRVEAALGTLSPRQRQVVLLRLWREMSVEETAAALSVSVGSVKTHLSRALETLRGALGDPRDFLDER